MAVEMWKKGQIKAGGVAVERWGEWQLVPYRILGLAKENY